MKTGRPTIYSAELINDLLAHYRELQSLTAACRRVRISRRTLGGWMIRRPSLRKRVDAVRQEFRNADRKRAD